MDEIIGQPEVVARLKGALEKNRLAHAYLFSGPRGVGKTSTARILAKSLNCKNGPTVKPCGKCPSCIEISQGRSLDVIEIDGASNRGIEEIRSLRENVKFAPASGKFKIYIIDEVHMLTSEAFNALLKTLEEPPEFVKFVFATTHPHKVIPTILSRCQRFDFRRISVREIISQLEKISKQENINIEKEVLFAIAKASDGSLRDAESILDQLVSFTKDKISLNDVISILGLVEQEALFELTDKIIQKDPKAALALFNGLIDEGKDIGVFLTNVIEHFRNLMIAKITGADAQLIDLPEDICKKLLEQSDAFTLEEIFSTFNILVSTQEMSKRLDSLRIPLEVSLIKLAHYKLGSKPDVAAVHNPPKEIKAQAKDMIRPAKEIDPPAVVGAIIPDTDKSSDDTASLDKIRGMWLSIIDSLSKIKISVSTYLNEGNPVKFEDNVLTVSFPKNYSLHKESLERKENRAIIEKALSESLNSELRVNFILSKESLHKDESQHSPFIKSALDAFKGRVIREE